MLTAHQRYDPRRQSGGSCLPPTATQGPIQGLRSLWYSALSICCTFDSLIYIKFSRGQCIPVPQQAL